MKCTKWLTAVSLVFFVVASMVCLIGCGGQPPPISPSPSTPPPSSSPSAPPPSSPPPLSAPSSPGELTIVSIVTGKVLVMKAETDTWIKVSADMTLEPGDRIKTGTKSNAVITFFEGSTIELKANAEIAVTEFNVADGTGSTTIKLRQEIGKTRSRVEKLIDPASRYEIETPAGAAVVRGSVGDVHVAMNGTTTIFAVEGQWFAVAQGKEKRVPEGMQCVIVVNWEPGIPVPMVDPFGGVPPAALPSSGPDVIGK